MKDVVKATGLLFTGLFAAVIVYPLLHEAGHALAAICLGAEVVKIQILPVPYIICNVYGLSDFNKSVIGLSGILFPILITIPFCEKHFWFWYGTLMLRGICLLSAVLSVIALICYKCGYEWKNEDIIQIVKIHGGGEDLWLALMLFIILILILLCQSMRPARKISRFFGL